MGPAVKLRYTLLVTGVVAVGLGARLMADAGDNKHVQPEPFPMGGEIDVVTTEDAKAAVLEPSDLAPDGEFESRFVPLRAVAPKLAAQLEHFFAQEFVQRAHKRPQDLAEVVRTTDIRVADWADPNGATLRLTSKLTGATYWYDGWDGEVGDAREWIEHHAAPAQAGIARQDEALAERDRRKAQQQR